MKRAFRRLCEPRPIWTADEGAKLATLAPSALELRELGTMLPDDCAAAGLHTWLIAMKVLFMV
jgi:hypothetical protein